MTDEQKEAIINAAKSCDELRIRFVPSDDDGDGFATIRPIWYRENIDEACRHLADLYKKCGHVQMNGWSDKAEVIIYGPHNNEDADFREWSDFEKTLRDDFDVEGE